MCYNKEGICLLKVLIKEGRYVKMVQISVVSPVVFEYFAGCMSKHFCCAHICRPSLFCTMHVVRSVELYNG